MSIALIFSFRPILIWRNVSRRNNKYLIHYQQLKKMIDLQLTHIPLLIGFALTSLIIELTPGPNMAYLAIISSRSGKRAGYFAVVGIAVGLMLIGIVAALGLTALIQESRWLYHSLRWCGIAYLFWLAWEAWRDADSKITADISSLDHNKFFVRGIITNLLNPKAGLFYVAVLPRFVAGEEKIAAQMMILSVIYVAVATLIHLSIVSLASLTNQFLQAPEKQLYFSRFLSLLLGCVAVWFAWSTRII